jgi:DNA-binding protein HU-alpha
MAPRSSKKPAPTAETPAAKPAKAAKPPRTAKAETPAKTLAARPAKAPPLRLKALVDTVAQGTGSKKATAKAAVEATLAALAAAIDSGTDLQLPPLGKLRVAKTSGDVTTLKLRKLADRKGTAKPLADDGEDD